MKSMDFVSLGDKMKSYEVSNKFRNDLPLYARLDGRAFSTFTRGMNKPYDMRFIFCMIEVTNTLIQKTNALIGFTQSDEISLVWECNKENPLSEHMFGGKEHKITSTLPSLASSILQNTISEFFDSPEILTSKFPHFDCRVLNLPDRETVSDMFLWRSIDAYKNSIQSVAQSLFSPTELHGKNRHEQLQMIDSKGKKYDKYPEKFRWGTWSIKKGIKYETENIVTSRRHIVNFSVPFEFVTNKVNMIFENEEPIISSNIHVSTNVETE